MRTIFCGSNPFEHTLKMFHLQIVERFQFWQMVCECNITVPAQSLEKTLILDYSRYKYGLLQAQGYYLLLTKLHNNISAKAKKMHSLQFKGANIFSWIYPETSYC